MNGFPSSESFFNTSSVKASFLPVGSQKFNGLFQQQALSEPESYYYPLANNRTCYRAPHTFESHIVLGHPTLFISGILVDLFESSTFRLGDERRADYYEVSIFVFNFGAAGGVLEAVLESNRRKGLSIVASHPWFSSSRPGVR